MHKTYTLHCRHIVVVVYSSCTCVIHLTLLVIVGFEAADEVGLAEGQSLHEGLQRLTELTAQRRHLLPFVSLGLHGRQRED